MAKAKKKLLPKDFVDLLKRGDLDALKAVFATCEIDARGGYGKHTALAFDECPDELARWLIEQGADLSATDTYGNTPLHSRAMSWHGHIESLLALGADVHNEGASIGTPLHAAAAYCKYGNARQLIDAGARVDAIDRDGLTPLELALRRCSNIDLKNMALLAETLIGAGARKSKRTAAQVTKIGEQFEFHRAGFNQEHFDAVSAALNRLYAIFDVTPVPRRILHDGKSPIVAKARSWRDQHQELWELLVPSNGAAATVQGEAIRIPGKIADELHRNGGGNWDADFRKMADMFLQLIAQGTSLPPPEMSEAADIVADVKRKNGDTERMIELAVAWVRLNPAPIAMAPPPYRR